MGSLTMRTRPMTDQLHLHHHYSHDGRPEMSDEHPRVESQRLTAGERNG